MKRTIAIAFTLVTSVSIAGAQALRPDSVAAVAAVEQFHAALAAADSSRAVSLLADDVLIVESGNIQTRAQYLGGHLGADMKASQGPKGDRSMVQVTIIGDAAYIVSKTVTAPSGVAGNTGSESAELMVVAKTPNGWKIKAVHWSSRRRHA